MIINSIISGGGGMDWETVPVSASNLTQDDLGFYGLIHAGMDAIKFIRTGIYNNANEELVLAYPWNTSQNKPITEITGGYTVQLELASTTIDSGVLYFYFNDSAMEGATIGTVRLS